MDNQVLQSDIDIAEAVDEYLHEQNVRIEDIQGSLEAIAEAIVGDEEPIQLTDHQQEMVDAFRDESKKHKGDVYAVVDKTAVEAYVDNRGNLQMDGDAPFIPVKPLDAAVAGAKKGDDPAMLAREHGANVFGSIEVHGILSPSNEGFLEATAAIAQRATIAFSEEIPKQFKITAKGLSHYVDMGQRLRERLLQLRPLLAKRDFPYVDVFDYGAYSRFFQIEGKSITSFSAFQEAMDVQNAATRHVMQAASSYAITVTEKLLKSLQELHPNKPFDGEQMKLWRDVIEQHWRYTWKEAEITPHHGQTPQVALNEFPDRKFMSLAPLLDNRYLVAHEPKYNGGGDPVKITSAVKHYGASLVFDKKAEKATEQSMNVPNVDDLLKLVDKTITVLGDMRSFETLAKKNNSFAKDFKKAADVFNKQAALTPNPQFYGFAAEYFKLATAISQAVQQPYVPMAWMYIRCALVVTSLVELAAVEEPSKRIAATRFSTKQGMELANPAMESFQLTKKALQAARRASVA